MLGGLSLTVLGYALLPAFVASAALFTTTIVNVLNSFSSGNLVMSATTPTSVVCTPATGSIQLPTRPLAREILFLQEHCRRAPRAR